RQLAAEAQQFGPLWELAEGLDALPRGIAMHPAALLGAAAGQGLTVRAKTVGPSNIGNRLAAEGIPATAGFGLPYEGLHGVDERVHPADLPLVHAVYRRAVLGLLTG
ncbi:hypothetical protein ABZ281_36680, partial [Streptomyces sp. NPDC006265]